MSEVSSSPSLQAALLACNKLSSEELVQLLQGYIDQARNQNDMLRAILIIISERLSEKEKGG